MSLKSHYGRCSAPAKADFLWFCSGAEEMREAKSPPSKIQKDMAGHEGLCFSVIAAPTASFHHENAPSSAATSNTEHSVRCRSQNQ